MLGTAIGFNQQSLIKRHILRNPGYHRGFRISHIFRHSAVVGILETENGMRLAHPVSAALAEPAFSAGDDLVCCNPVSQGEAFHLRTHFNDAPYKFMARYKGRLYPGSFFFVSPEHGRSVLAFQIPCTDAAAFCFDYDVVLPAFGNRIGGFQPIVTVAIGYQRFHGFR